MQSPYYSNLKNPFSLPSSKVTSLFFGGALLSALLSIAASTQAVRAQEVTDEEKHSIGETLTLTCTPDSTISVNGNDTGIEDLDLKPGMRVIFFRRNSLDTSKLDEINFGDPRPYRGPKINPKSPIQPHPPALEWHVKSAEKSSDNNSAKLELVFEYPPGWDS